MIKRIGSLLVGFLVIFNFAHGQMSPKERQALQEYATELAARSAEARKTLEAEAARLDIPLAYRSGDRYFTLEAIIKGQGVYNQVDNLTSQEDASADQVKTGGDMDLELTGAGIRVGVWEAFEGPDTANVRTTHVEFDGRATNFDAGDFSNHATHVAGTIGALGVDATAEGYATAAELDCYDIDSDLAEMAAAALAADPILISNHSYGLFVGWTWDGSMWNHRTGTVEDWMFGAYTDLTEDWDNLAYNAPFLLVMKSSGNHRNDVGTQMAGDPPPDGNNGFDVISPRGVAKNIMTVGANFDNPSGNYTGPGDVQATAFSSWGPTDDGRVKPDIVANGSGLWSPIGTGDTDYDSYSGTSMSTPSLSGGAALLYEHWNNVLEETPRAASMKALLLESADEAGPNDGPDYSNGWGAMNVADAAQLITVEGFEGCTQYHEGVLEADETFEFTLHSSGDVPLKVTLVWHDPAATNTNNGTVDPNASYLVNDLDLAVIRADNTVFQPFVLNPANPAAAATTGINNRDNVEQVLIVDPDEDVYTIRVTAPASLENDEQRYSLWWLGNGATE
ncbi:MAG: S8 family serine peptidase, partial [Bacteroidota bacterium]